MTDGRQKRTESLLDNNASRKKWTFRNFDAKDEAKRQSHPYPEEKIVQRVYTESTQDLHTVIPKKARNDLKWCVSWKVTTDKRGLEHVESTTKDEVTRMSSLFSFLSQQPYDEDDDTQCHCEATLQSSWLCSSNVFVLLSCLDLIIFWMEKQLSVTGTCTFEGSNREIYFAILMISSFGCCRQLEVRTLRNCFASLRFLA